MTVERIFIAAKRGDPMQDVASVRAIAGAGLEGDRYTRVASKHTADYQLTPIEAEAIEGFAASTGLAFRPDEPRRNIVTRVIEGGEIRVGHALESATAAAGGENAPAT